MQLSQNTIKQNKQEMRITIKCNTSFISVDGHGNCLHMTDLIIHIVYTCQIVGLFVYISVCNNFNAHSINDITH